MAASRALFANVVVASPPSPLDGVRGRRRGKVQFRVKAKAAGDSVSYQGVYGEWKVEESDVKEVLLYRAGLVSAAASLVAGCFWDGGEDVAYAVGSFGLGASLLLIHIYVTPIKRTLQALWCLGAAGSVLTYSALAAPAGEGLVQYVLDHPPAVWLVGPLFASLTGLVFKEGLCYGKLEAALLTFLIPTLLLGHLSGVMDDSFKLILLRASLVLLVVFAGRKFSQPIKDDIGDKSVFIFNALPKDEKEALIRKLQQQQQQSVDENTD